MVVGLGRQSGPNDAPLSLQSRHIGLFTTGRQRQDGSCSEADTAAQHSMAASSRAEEIEHVQRILTRIESFILPPSHDPLALNLSTLHTHNSSNNNNHINNNNNTNDSHQIKRDNGHNREQKRDTSSRPFDRLDETLFQLALADHIRTLQTVYRDFNDEHCLSRELRGIDLNIFLQDQQEGSPSYERLCTKELLEKILEGRSRAFALVRMCYGDASLPCVRADLDLAAVYSLQGGWEQAEEHVVRALQRLANIEEQEVDSVQSRQHRRAALLSAQRITTIYEALRQHVAKHGGHVAVDFVDELQRSFGDVLTTGHPDHLLLPHPTPLLVSLRDFLSSSNSNNSNNPHNNSRLPLKHLSQSYFHDADNAYLGSSASANNNNNNNSNNSNNNSSSNKKSWGEVVRFLRSDRCPTMETYVETVKRAILPQAKASLLLPFRLCDVAERDLAHPTQLSSALKAFPSTTKLLNGDLLSLALNRCRTVVPLVVNAHTGSVQNLHSNAVQQQSVVYELPVTVEEYLALYLVEDRSIALDDAFMLCKTQVLTLKGVCGVNLEQWALAEELLTQALQEMERLSLDSDAAACELFNAIAQMMICKHSIAAHTRKQRVKQEAEAWMLHTDDGKRAVKVQTKKLKKAENDLSAAYSGHAEFEYRAREMVLKARTKILLDEAEASAIKDSVEFQSLEAAHRYLVKTLGILENAHGVNHPLTGAACLAIASVQNLRHDLDDTRNWLLKTIRTFEKAPSCSEFMFFPAPVRAIAFAQTQLAQVLSKRGYDEEGQRVLQNASDLYMSLAMQSMRALQNSHRTVNIDDRRSAKIRDRRRLDGEAKRDNRREVDKVASLDTARSQTSRASLASDATCRRIDPREKFARNNNDERRKAVTEETDDDEYDYLFSRGSYNLVLPVILKGTSLDDDLQHAMSLSHEVVKLSQRSGNNWEAAQQCDRLSRLIESCFGWDSLEAAEAQRDVSSLFRFWMNSILLICCSGS
jgi:hypothetical protein